MCRIPGSLCFRRRPRRTAALRNGSGPCGQSARHNAHRGCERHPPRPRPRGGVHTRAAVAGRNRLTCARPCERGRTQPLPAGRAPWIRRSRRPRVPGRSEDSRQHTLPRRLPSLDDDLSPGDAPPDSQLLRPSGAASHTSSGRNGLQRTSFRTALRLCGSHRRQRGGTHCRRPCIRGLCGEPYGNKANLPPQPCGDSQNYREHRPRPQRLHGNNHRHNHKRLRFSRRPLRQQREACHWAHRIAQGICAPPL